MKKILFSIPLLLIITGCNGQPENNKKPQSLSADTIKNKPVVNWKVNKKYDDEGNIIAYDSTYTWSYTSKDGTVNNIAADSVMTAFKNQFNQQFHSVFMNEFGSPIWTDSLFERDFNDSDYFMKKWENHYFDMYKIMGLMDSMRNSFLEKNYPGLHIQKE